MRSSLVSRLCCVTFAAIVFVALASPLQAQRLRLLTVPAENVNVVGAGTLAENEATGQALSALCRYMSLTKPDGDLTTLTGLGAKLAGRPPLTGASLRDKGVAMLIAGSGGTSVAWAIGACALIVSNHVLADIDPAKPDDGHRELVELDFTLSRFNHWLEKWRTSQRKADATAAGAADMTEALERVNQERARVAAEMRRHDLLNPFSAAFFAGTAIGGSGRLIGDLGDAAVRNRISEREASLQTTRFTLESAHFGWQGEHMADGSFRAQVGFQPVLTVLSATTESAGKAAVVSVLQPALVTSVGGRFGFPMEKIISELSFVVSTGAARPTADAVTFDDKKPPLVASPVKDGSTKTAWFSETGFEFTMFDNPVRVLHAEKGLVNPAVLVAGGYRYDARFRADEFSSLGDGFTASPHRLYFRFMVDTVKTVSRREVAEKPKTFDLGFGIEYERSLGTSSVPSTTRFVIRGNINLLKAAGSDAEKEKEKAKN